jgi:hypothetical protein
VNRIISLPETEEGSNKNKRAKEIRRNREVRSKKVELPA